MKMLVLAAMLLGCTDDHVIGSTNPSDATTPDASTTDARTIDAPIDAPMIDGMACGASGEPCCTVGRACMGNLRCMNGVCR